MPTPRENTSIVKAPVLFRLPHLQRAAAARRTSAVGGGFGIDPEISPTSGVAENSSRGSDATNVAAQPAASTSVSSMQNRTPVENSTLSAGMATPVKPERTTASDESFMTRWGFHIKRSVILLAAMALLWGAWAIGQKSSVAPEDSNLTEVSDPQENSGVELASESVVIEPAEALPAANPVSPRVAQIVEPKLSSASGSSSDFVTEPQRSAEGGKDVEADFSTLSIDSLEPPSNGEFYGDYDLGPPSSLSAQKPPLDRSTPGQMALNEPAAVEPAESTLPAATNFVPSATPEMPGFDPNQTGDIGNTTPQNRPALSSTPNGIIDWSRYLPGAGGSGAIRAVSATQAIGAAAEDGRSTDTQAIYLDKNDPNSPNVGVAPFYR